jgi:TonB family protein
MFSTVLDDSGRPASSRRGLRLPFGAAFGLHAGALVFILAARAWSFQEPPDPPIPIVFYAPPGAPPLGDEGAGTPVKKADEKRDDSTPTKAEDRLPETVKDVPADAPADNRAPAADETGSRASSEDPGDGKGDGTKRQGTGIGQAGGQCPDCPGVIDQGGKIYLPGGDVRPPVLTLRIEPVYPEAARKIHAEGTVVVDAVISATGVVEEVRVVKSAHPLLDAAAVDAVGRWRYSPATLNGQPVRVLLSVTVRFSLH